MPQLRQLDLQLTFEAARALREDIENQSGTIQYATLQERLEIAFLTWRERMIENHEIRLLALYACVDLFRFAAADEQPRIGRAPSTSDQRKHVCACRSRERIELAQLIFAGSVPQSDADQERAFAAAGTFKQ